MVRLLSIISLILALVLFPPAALAVISNNAVPGDATYPIKRSLEDVIFAVASLNPNSKAWFSAARSDRRFTEFKTLLAQGKKGADTLNELVEQTQVTATQIAQVNDSTEKAKLIEQLSANIDKYDQGLKQVSTPTTTSPAVNNNPTTLPTNQPTVTQAPTPISTAQPTPAPSREDENERQRQRELEEARRRLEEIRRGLEGESSHRDSSQSVQGNQDNKQKDDNRKDDHSSKSSDKAKERGKSGRGVK